MISRLGMISVNTWRARSCSPLCDVLGSQQEVPKCPSKGLLLSLTQLPGQELPKRDFVLGWDVQGMFWMRHPAFCWKVLLGG